mmetsp:Transcript_53253/g.142506  ORF Transcript_53253/g.142506 Transcript_53253/m.142506 type:complete len:271 (-) Transcript_53253:941-1753(-)
MGRGLSDGTLSRHAPLLSFLVLSIKVQAVPLGMHGLLLMNFQRRFLVFHFSWHFYLLPSRLLARPSRLSLLRPRSLWFLRQLPRLKLPPSMVPARPATMANLGLAICGLGHVPCLLRHLGVSSCLCHRLLRFGFPSSGGQRHVFLLIKLWLQSQLCQPQLSGQISFGRSSRRQTGLLSRNFASPSGSIFVSFRSVCGADRPTVQGLQWIHPKGIAHSQRIWQHHVFFSKAWILATRSTRILPASSAFFSCLGPFLMSSSLFLPSRLLHLL